MFSKVEITFIKPLNNWFLNKINIKTDVLWKFFFLQSRIAKSPYCKNFHASAYSNFMLIFIPCKLSKRLFTSLDLFVNCLCFAFISRNKANTRRSIPVILAQVSGIFLTNEKISKEHYLFRKMLSSYIYLFEF